MTNSKFIPILFLLALDPVTFLTGCSATGSAASTESGTTLTVSASPAASVTLGNTITLIASDSVNTGSTFTFVSSSPAVTVPQSSNTALLSSTSATSAAITVTETLSGTTVGTTSISVSFTSTTTSGTLTLTESPALSTTAPGSITLTATDATATSPVFAFSATAQTGISLTQSTTSPTGTATVTSSIGTSVLVDVTETVSGVVTATSQVTLIFTSTTSASSTLGCTITVSPAVPVVGQNVVFTLNTYGTITRAVLDGDSVSAVGSVVATVGNLGTFTVYGYVGNTVASNSCQATFSTTSAASSSTPFTAIVGPYMSGEGIHSVGGGGCPANFQTVGSFADCGGGVCYGNQVMCTYAYTYPNNYDATPVVTAVEMTPENTHVVGGDSIAMTLFGTIADCGFGTCYGNQALRVTTQAWSTVPEGQNVLVGLSLTPENSHIVGGNACPAGYVSIGTSADCGNGVCYGDQRLCARYSPKY